MTRIIVRAAVVAAACVAGSALVRGQAREWTTSGHDAQRTAWVRSDARITREAVEDGTFRFLWKAQFHNESRQLNSLTQPVLQDLLIGYLGFKTLAFIGGSADRVFAIDTDLNRPYWTTHVTYAAATGGQPPSSWECPGGLIATPSRRTPLVPSAFGGGFGGGRGSPATSAVGEPGKGAAVLAERQAKPRTPPAPPSGDAAPPGAPGAGPARRVAPVPFGGVDPLYVVGADGLLRTLRVSDGANMEPPVPFLPPSTRPSALLFVDGFVYTATSNGCGAAPNAVWAIDTTAEDKKVVTWETGGPSVAGTSGPAFGTDGTLYVALGAAPPPLSKRWPATNGQSAGTSYASSVVALDRFTLQPKGWFTAEGADFNGSPVVIRHKDKDLVAVSGNDGRLYLLEGGASIGGADHKTPLYVTPKYTTAGNGAGLATWEQDGTRWLLAPVSGAVPSGITFTSNGAAPRGSIVAFRLADRDGKFTLEPAWQSRDLLSPLAPIVVNGMVFAAESGEYTGADARELTAAQRARKSTPASLYALDGTTGRELWGSGKTITSFARAGLAAGGGQVYLVTYDNSLYAFGIPMEH